MLSELAMSSLTDIILSCELFFLSGLSFRGKVVPKSPAWYWAFALLLIGVASMLGAIDHGFFEPVGHPWHRAMIIVTRVTIIVGSMVILLATASQFLPPKGRRLVLGIGGLCALAALAVVLTSDDFLSVIVFYLLAFLLLLGLSLAGLRRGTGSISMVVGILLTIAASLMVPLGSNGVPGLGLWGTYHVILMVASFALYLGGRQLRRTL
ncbi:DUF6962 family protein [Rhodospirillum sp. A1_3_36]|uniref:DUF6962 family protein n=1 Tax=Rhodospirillum sp. A1_3_36 TaxID=3391666 RepID=UPI0039A5FE40